MTFIKNVEDFDCDKCSVSVSGDGYTNHCTNCLWSKHVDVEPGDRAATCEGLMEPVDIEIKGDGVNVLHQCEKCGHQKKNKVSPQDSHDKIVELSAKGKK